MIVYFTSKPIDVGDGLVALDVYMTPKKNDNKPK